MKPIQASRLLILHRLSMVLLAVICISAAPNSQTDELIRQGNKFFEKEDFENALKKYDDAEERATDPGMIAFNKATAYWHRGEFRQAENHYRMALDDAAAPVERRARAFYNLANCLVKQSGERDHVLLREAIRYYEFALEMAVDVDLRRITAHNLELAKLAWNKARASSANPPTPNSAEPPDTPRRSDPKKEKKSTDTGNGKDPNNKIDPKAKIDKGTETVEPKSIPNETDHSPKAGPGRIPVIPDKDELQPLDPADTRDALNAVEDRLNQIRKRLRGYAAIPERPSGKDW